MKFENIDKRLTIEMANEATTKFRKLMLEIGIREDNYFCGTGLGGNNFQLLTLMNMRHNVVKQDIDIRAHGDRVSWGARWLRDTNMRRIRGKLDEVFPQIRERNKMLSLVLEAIASTRLPLRCALAQYKDQFPKLMDVLNGTGYSHLNELSTLEQYILACVLCQEMSAALDKGQTDLVQPVGLVLAKLPQEVVLLSVREYVCIKRLIRHQLDEDQVWKPMLCKINDDVD